MSRRAEQMASTLDRALRQVFSRGLADPRVRGIVTITGVRVSEDLREATVSVSILPEEMQDLTIHGIRAAAGHIRHELDDLIEARQTPKLTFKLDTSLKIQAKVSAAIAKAAADLEARAADPTPRFSPPSDAPSAPESPR